MAAVKKYYAATAILVGGEHHDAGDEVTEYRDKEDAEALVRMGRCHNDDARAKADRDARAAIAKAAAEA